MPYNSGDKTEHEHHNDGQADGAEGTYNPPHESTTEVFRDDEQIADRKSYDTGYQNGK